MFSITSICVNGGNYAQWPDVVEVFLLGRKQYHYTDDTPPPSPQALNMLIGKLKIPKLGVACGIAWNLRSVRVWFSYQLSNLFGNIPRSCTLVLTILWKFMIFIKLVSPLLSIICLWKTIMEILRVYVKNLIFTNPSLM